MKHDYHSLNRLALPYVAWLVLLAIVPFILMMVLAFFSIEGIDFSEATFTMGNFSQLTEVSTVTAFKNSLFYSIIATIICIVLGYILAYSIFRSKFKNKFVILVIVILPMWTNILLRIDALGNIMQETNMVQGMLANIGIGWGIDIKGTGLAVLIGLVFTYLPFMVLPIYTALEKIDYSLEEASLDLGATEFQKFWKVMLPLSSKGIVTGSIMVFLPCLSGFAIPEILGNGNILFIGNIIEQSFRNMSYGIGSLLAVVILVIILGSLFIVNKVDKEGETLL